MIKKLDGKMQLGSKAVVELRSLHTPGRIRNMLIFLQNKSDHENCMLFFYLVLSWKAYI